MSELTEKGRCAATASRRAAGKAQKCFIRAEYLSMSLSLCLADDSGI